MNYFTSDWHFGHKNIIEYQDRPFSSVEEMDQKLIENWNSIITPKDTVWFLGDFSFHNREKTLKVIKQLKGKINFIFGNHDNSIRVLNRSNEMPDRVKCFGDYHEFNFNKQKYVLCHFPFESWHVKGIHLHGHIHNPDHTIVKPNRVNVNLDATVVVDSPIGRFGFWTLEDITKYVELMRFL